MIVFIIQLTNRLISEIRLINFVVKNSNIYKNILNKVRVLAIMFASPRNCILVKNVPISNRETSRMQFHLCPSQGLNQESSMQSTF